MEDATARKIALKYAAFLTPTSAEHPFDADKLVAAAEKFHAFLTGGTSTPAQSEPDPELPADLVRGMLKDEAAKREPEGLAKGDQTPAAFIIGDGPVQFLGGPFDDDVKTRLVRPT
jgi:hypothetical protein